MHTLQQGFDPAVLFEIVAFFVLLLAGYAAYKFTLKILLPRIAKLATASRNQWDNIFIENRVLHYLAHLVPATLFYQFGPILLRDQPVPASLFREFVFLYIVLVLLLAANATLNAGLEIYQQFPVSQRFPLKGFVQALKIILFLAGSILLLSILTGKSPLVFFSGLGAMTAVLMLVFKDAILGFVAGIQLTANNMVRKGDWIEMPQFGADGDVLDVSLTTVKVQNWDKTITSIPAYALISQSFKNWRGMEESGGRRIKRAIHIDMNSIRFCDEGMLDRFSHIQYLRDYLDEKRKALSDYNRRLGVDPSVLVNGRRLTNIGTFRAYVREYLKHHPKIHQGMTFLVRQLNPGPTGLPLEIYVFSNDQVWANYEEIQSDIFDHLLAALPEFDLNVFQNPTGADLRAWKSQE
ncbi:MAG: mechanosensitive ion channel [Deltaproteobacteria bacterium]|nr:mechanosensitive ion channel [Deltaproteobacteria bacterium]